PFPYTPLFRSRRSRVPAARGLQPRLPVPPGGRAWQTGAQHGDGIRLQRGRGDCHARDRFATRAADRDPHQQLRPVQRALSHADHAGDDLRRRIDVAALRVDRGRGGRRRYRRDRRHHDARGVAAAVRHRPGGRGVGLQPRTAAIQTARHPANSLHVADRPNALRARAGEASAFSLELPPYRRPAILRILYTSLIDRTLFVLGRAMVTAAPAGAVIWLLANISVGNESLAARVAGWLAPLGHAVGLDGAILLAYVIAIPANEIVVPTLMMVYMGTDMMTDVTSSETLRRVLVDENGWTLL